MLSEQEVVQNSMISDAFRKMCVPRLQSQLHMFHFFHLLNMIAATLTFARRGPF